MQAPWRSRPLRTLFGVVCLAFLSSAAQASQVIYAGTYFDVELSDPVEVGNTPLLAVTLTAIGHGAVLPNTFDSTFSGTPQPGQGITTVGDLLHQVWEFGATGILDTPTLTLAGDPVPIPQARDTHFLVLDADVIATLAPAETRPTLNNTEDPRAGYGNSLYGAFSLKQAPAQLTQRWDFAYVVVPEGTQVSLVAAISGVDLADHGYSNSVNTSFTVVPVPEPSTLILLALSLVALASRRRP